MLFLFLMYFFNGCRGCSWSILKASWKRSYLPRYDLIIYSYIFYFLTQLKPYKVFTLLLSCFTLFTWNSCSSLCLAFVIWFFIFIPKLVCNTCHRTLRFTSTWLVCSSIFFLLKFNLLIKKCLNFSILKRQRELRTNTFPCRFSWKTQNERDIHRYESHNFISFLE